MLWPDVMSDVAWNLLSHTANSWRLPLMLVSLMAEWISRRTASGRALKDGANAPLLAPSDFRVASLTGAFRTGPVNSLRQVEVAIWTRVEDAMWLAIVGRGYFGEVSCVRGEQNSLVRKTGPLT